MGNLEAVPRAPAFERGNSPARSGSPRWRRLTEVRAGARSVFHFEGKVSRAKATHAGLPWLLHLRRQAPRVHFWPVDGWHITARRSVIADVYPSPWSRSFPREGRDPRQHDAYSTTAWMRNADENIPSCGFFVPHLDQNDREMAVIEGRILGVA
jgi:hypothetical protein